MSISARYSRENPLGAFLAEARVSSQAAARGRLIFGLDATASRKPTWDMAASLQAEMFREAAKAGNLDLQLAFYRGDGECKATSWISDPTRLARVMSRIDCRAGMTQIAKILIHAQKETALLHVGALVFIGDAMEESADVFSSPERASSVGRRPPLSCFRKVGIPRSNPPFARSPSTRAALMGASTLAPPDSWASFSGPLRSLRPEA